MTMLEGPDCPLHIEQVGAGLPITIFSHGVTGSIDELLPLASRTAGTRVLLDLRGHGGSGHPPVEAGYDHAAMRRDVEFVADAVGATQAFGTSMSAGALINLLAEKPDRFERVGLFLPASIDGPNEGATGLFPMFASDLETTPIEVLAERAATEANPLYDVRPYWRDLVRRRTLLMNGVGVPRALRAYVSGRPPVADVDALRAVTAPVLILAHHGDPIHDVRHAERLATIFPNARLEVWPETLAMYDDVDAFATLIGEFFAG